MNAVHLLAGRMTVLRFFLRPHVFICATDEGCIFLDGERDKYLGLSAKKAHALSRILHGFPNTRAFADPISIQDAAVLANQLSAAGLLTQIESAGKPATPVAVAPAEAHVDWNGAKPNIRPHHIRVFFASAALTAIALRRYSHAQIINALQERKSNFRNPPDPRAAYKLAHVFHLIRPFGYTVKNQCLFDSLTLMRFMLHYGISPTLIFGVRVSPFFAHCWVQVDRLALNCSVEYARALIPIRTV